jgi:hypothetical protein
MPPPSHQAASRSRDRSPRCPMPPPSRQARSRPRGRSPRCRSRSRHHRSRSRSRRGSSDCRSRFDRGPEPVAPTPRQARGSNRGRGGNRNKAANTKEEVEIGAVCGPIRAVCGPRPCASNNTSCRRSSKQNLRFPPALTNRWLMPSAHRPLQPAPCLTTTHQWQKRRAGARRHRL